MTSPMGVRDESDMIRPKHHRPPTSRTTSIPRRVRTRREIVYGLTDDEVRDCMLQMFADDDERRRMEHPERPIPGTIENSLRPFLVKLEGAEPRESLLAQLFMRDEHIWANHPQSEEASDPPDAYIRSLIEQVRAREA